MFFPRYLVSRVVFRYNTKNENKGSLSMNNQLTPEEILKHFEENAALIEVGSGMREPESITEILALKDRKMAGPTAPPHGLTLVKIIYKNEENYLQNS